MVNKLLIIGGGITGLSAAYYAQKQCEAQGIQAHITLVEQANTLGGKIQTLHRDGFIIECGPDSFLARKQPIIDLTFALDLADELVATNPQANKTYIVKNGCLHRIPAGLVLGIPTKLGPFMKSGLISPLGKLRALCDFVIPNRLIADEHCADAGFAAGESFADESLGEFLERRLGKEVRRYMADPLLAGIYAGDTNALSLQATFPQFQQFEATHGSVIKGMLHSRRSGNPHSKHAKYAPNERVDPLPVAVRGSVFLSFRKGLYTVVDALWKQLQRHNVAIQTGISVKRVLPNHSTQPQREPQQLPQSQLHDAEFPTLPRYDATLSSDDVWAGDAIIAAVPPHELAAMLRERTGTAKLDPSWEQAKQASVANVVLAYERRHMTHLLDGSGFVVPRSEQLFMTACTWTSSKWPHVAPPNYVLLRCYVGHATDERWLLMGDDDIVRKVRSELRQLMGIHAEPLFYEVKRWQRAMPQYEVDHVRRLDELERSLEATWPGLFVAGASYAGVGIPDCVAQGKRAAEQAVQHICAK